MSKKKMSLANFNITFGEKQEPLLKYFEDYVYPAFTRGIKRDYKDDTFFWIK